MNWPAIVWFIFLVIFVLAEAATVTVVSLWFAAGALVAMIVSMLGGPVWLQVLLFIVVSFVLLWMLRPILKKFYTPKLTRTNVDSVIGSQGYVTQRIDNVKAAGQVKLGAMEWTARSTTGDPIEEGTLVRVDKIEGVKVFVTTVKEPVTQ